MKFINIKDSSVVEAEQYTSWDKGKKIGMHTDGFGSHYIQHCPSPEKDWREFPEIGDWIVLGINNHAFTLFKPEAFNDTYKPMAEENANS